MNFKNTLLPTQTILQSRGRLLHLSRPVVMGILNATPDSFYNKGRESTTEGLLKNAEKMIADGAAILDVGGASTRPNAPIISADEELERIMPVITAIHENFPNVWMSVDTYRASVAKEAVAGGAAIVNDVSAGRLDEKMIPVVAELGVPYIIMHMQGTPQTMQQNPQYSDVVTEVRDYLRETCDVCSAQGIKDIIIDPGFGFGKTIAHNFELLRSLHTLRIQGRVILAGLSRKSMIYKTLNTDADHALNGTTALNMIALQQGANILRVHDVRETAETIQLFESLNNPTDK